MSKLRLVIYILAVNIYSKSVIMVDYRKFDGIDTDSDEDDERQEMRPTKVPDQVETKIVKA